MRLTGTCDTCGADTGPAFVRCLPCNGTQLAAYLEAARAGLPTQEGTPDE